MDLQQGSTVHDRGELSDADRQVLVDRAIARYIDDGGLIGSIESVAPTLARIAAAGVDEVACLIDFCSRLPRTHWSPPLAQAIAEGSL